MTDHQFTLYMTSQWFMVIATLLLGAIAIWGDWIKAKLIGPRLVVDILNPMGEATQFSDGVASRHYHLIVRNKIKSSPAHNVRVLMTGLSRPTADGRYGNSTLSGGVQFVWQFKDSVPQFPVIGSPLICDLGNIRQDGPFTLATMFRPIYLDTTINSNQRAKVTVQAVSDECVSPPLNVEISWDGKWEEDTGRMAEHVVIKVV